VSRKGKFLVGGLVIVAALAYLIYAGVSQSVVYFVTPSELGAAPVAGKYRVWGNFMGRGFTEPVDDVRVTNPASNEELFVIERLARAKEQIEKCQQPTNQVHSVRCRQKIEERTVRMTRDVNALPHKLPPGPKLRSKESKPEHRRDQQPAFV